MADRSLCLLPTDVTGRQRSVIYGGARPWSALNVSKQHELDALWDAKPVKAIPQHVLDVVVQCFFAPTSNRAAVCSATAYFAQMNDDDDDDDRVYLSVSLCRIW